MQWNKLATWLSGRNTPQDQIAGRRRIDLGAAPPRYPIYAIGDIHGCLKELKDAEVRIAEDIRSTGKVGLVVLLGDFVDRGPSSRQVLDHLIAPSELGLRRLPLCGNHDELFLNLLDDPKLYPEFLKFGGEQTLLSYGIDIAYLSSQRTIKPAALGDILHEAIPLSHRHFLQSLPIYLKIGPLMFVHAGIMPGVAPEDQTDQDMMWIREPFLSKGPEQPFVVVHGHTPVAEPSFGTRRIGIDTGAYYSGKLTVLKLSGSRATVL